MKIDIDTVSFTDTIKHNLVNKIPLSVIRYGDGETMMLSGIEEDISFILKKVLGYVPSSDELDQITQNLIDAYKNCDIIGIPTERHLRREDHWSKSLIVFSKAVGVDVNFKLLTSVDIFYDMLASNSFKDILQDLDTLNYISCRNLDKEFKEKFNIKNTNHFIISPEPTYTSGYIGDKHYPEQFNQIKEWIKTIPCKGNLCLVGAGIPGKIYNNWFRDEGGVSLDIGSVFDAWAGKKTRGAGRGLDAIDNTYKL